MDASSNDLTKPLGHIRPVPRRRGRIAKVAALALPASASLIAVAFVGAAIYGDPRGGRPTARVEISREAPDTGLQARRDPVVSPSSSAPRRDAGTVEAQSGVSVVRPAGTAAPDSVIVSVPDDDLGRLARAPDPRLIDKTRYGLLPRTADGARAVDIYARKPGELPNGVQPSGRVALVVGGLGISRTATEDAISGLPGAVTLAFAPYGADLERYAEQARAGGHEIVLQIPMEPFDFPDSDPGPHTLTTTAKPAEMLDHLHWAMGRFTGYVALMNYMGGKLTADQRALSPILREAGQRGIGFIDDGSSARSLVTTLAGETPAVRADLVIDAVPRADLIDKALGRLEAAAASGRIAVGTASALPITVERVSRWAKGLEARGILLVPASAALAARPRESVSR